LDEADVVLGDVSVTEFGPEAGRLLGADQRLDDAEDFRWGAGAHEFEHVAFGDQPVAEIDPLDRKALAAGIDKTGAFDVNEVGSCGAGTGGRECDQNDDHQRGKSSGKTTISGTAGVPQRRSLKTC